VLFAAIVLALAGCALHTGGEQEASGETELDGTDGRVDDGRPGEDADRGPDRADDALVPDDAVDIDALPAEDAPTDDAPPPAEDVAADTGPCGPGRELCGSECVSLESDVRHCGRCGNACPSGPGAAASCIGGTCGLACADGWGDCDGIAASGCEMPLESNVVHCGACGNACPFGSMSSPTCTDSRCGLSCVYGWSDCDGDPSSGCETGTLTDTTNCGGCGVTCPGITNGYATCPGTGHCSATCNSGYVLWGSVCAAFGGAWETNDCGLCSTPNPFTSPAGCSCPLGFATSAGMRIVNDCPADGRYLWAMVYFCYAPVWSGTADFAGTYQRHDPSAGGGCVIVNPYTGACSCPAGTAAIELRAETADFHGTSIGVCRNPSAAVTTFAGAYEVGDVGWVCLVANPATGGCSCPSGITPFPLRGIFRHGSPAGNWGTQMWICP